MGKLKVADFGVAIYILAAFIMLIVPIPSWLLDMLLAVNDAVSPGTEFRRKRRLPGPGGAREGIECHEISLR